MKDIPDRSPTGNSSEPSSPYAFFDEMLEGCQVIGHDWTYLYVNDAVAKHARMSKEALLGRTMTDVFPGIADMPFFSTLRLCMEDRKLRQFENPFTFPDGNTGYFELRLIPVPEGVLILSLDITKHKLIENELRVNKNRLELVLRGGELGTWDWNFKTGEVAFNERWARMLGYRLDEIVPHVRAWEALVHPDDMPAVMKVLNEHLDGKTPGYESEHRLRHKSGEWIWVLDKGSVLQRDTDGTPLRVCGTHLDITGRKRTEAKLSRSERFLNHIIDQNPYPIWISDAHGSLIRINGACRELLNAGNDDAIAEYNILKDETIIGQGHLPLVQSVFNEGKTVNFTVTYDSSRLKHLELDGFTDVVLDVTISPVQDEAGIITNAVIMPSNVTKKKFLEEQLLQSQKMEAIGQLTGGIAHDFNNMLSVILGNAELLKSTVPPQDPLLKGVVEIENAALHSRDITHQLLAFSRKQIVTPRSVELNGLIKNKENTLRKLIGENIDLRVMPQQGLWRIRIDPVQVDQILFNMAANARDAMPDGGVFSVRTVNADIDETYCATHVECRPGQYVVLSMADTGYGMDKETLSHLFEPFYTTKKLGKGTGLGLATVYGITRQNGGCITVASEPGRGTTFSLYLPRLTADDREEAAVRQDAVESRPATILLVEDDAMVRRTTTTILKKLGHSVITAGSPGEALAVSEDRIFSIDLLMTDVIMPQMSGPELTAEIRKIEPDLKVLFMSGYTENVISRQGVLKEGAYYIQKPFTIHDLSGRIAEVLAG